MFGHDIISVSISIAFLLNIRGFYLPVTSYVLPEPSFEVLKPKGIRISIPDESGLRFFAFQGNVNKRITQGQSGEISGEVYAKRDGKWSIENREKNFVDGDVVNYWISVQVDGTMYKRGELSWTVTSEKGISTQTEVQPTERITSGTLVFEENFDSLNKSIWEREVKMAMSPDYEFCVYHNEHHEHLVKTQGGTLRIKPIILEDSYGENATVYGTLILSGCTSSVADECSRKAFAFNILPPIISARINTKNSFYFRYGKIEIRAKFPEGDWLYPELWLEPRYNNYGEEYKSGRILLGLARGNDNLVNTTTASIFDSRRLDFGFMIGITPDIKSHLVSKIQEYGTRWTKDFHVYTTVWNSNGFVFSVDGEQVGSIEAPRENEWMQSGSVNKMAPFDQEFYISIGVGVGGVRVFPDGTTSSGQPKPWKNVGAKAMLKFWHSKNQWLPSWRREKGAKTALEIDYIRVWSV